MAFVTLFKNIVSRTKSAIRRALPVVRKIIDTTKKVAPIIGNTIGGNAGKLFTDIGKYAGSIENGINKLIPLQNNTSSTLSQPLQLPNNGFTNISPDRFTIPMLK